MLLNERSARKWGVLVYIWSCCKISCTMFILTFLAGIWQMVFIYLTWTIVPEHSRGSEWHMTGMLNIIVNHQMIGMPHVCVHIAKLTWSLCSGEHVAFPVAITVIQLLVGGISPADVCMHSCRLSEFFHTQQSHQ